MKFRILGLLATSVTLAGMTATANADGAYIKPSTLPNGFYIGVDAGAADLMNKESHSVNPESHQLGAVGPVVGAYVGYDYGITCQYRLAIEAFGDATWLQTEIQHAGNTYKMNQVYNLGVRLLPEYVFTPNTMGHLIFGYANGRFEIIDNGVYGFVNSSFNASAFQTGVGLSTLIQDNFFVRLDALYDLYSSKTQNGTGLTGAGSSQIYTNRFSQLAGEISVYYKFA